MKNPKEQMQILIDDCYKDKVIEIAISIYEDELEFIIYLEKFHCIGCDDMLKRISQLKEAIEMGKRSLE